MWQRLSDRTRRDLSPEGLSRRARFEASIDRLRRLGLSDRAIEYYRSLARETQRLPHVAVCELAESAAALARARAPEGRQSD